MLAALVATIPGTSGYRLGHLEVPDPILHDFAIASSYNNTFVLVEPLNTIMEKISPYSFITKCRIVFLDYTSPMLSAQIRDTYTA